MRSCISLGYDSMLRVGYAFPLKSVGGLILCLVSLEFVDSSRPVFLATPVNDPYFELTMKRCAKEHVDLA